MGSSGGAGSKGLARGKKGVTRERYWYLLVQDVSF